MCLTAEATAEEREEILRAGAVGARREGRPVEALARRDPRPRPPRVRVRAVDLTRENTAIVLDSTSDFFDARERHANMRIVPLYVLFDGEALRDHVDIAPAAFYERLAALEDAPDDLPADPGRLPRLLRGAPRRGVRAHLVAPPHLEAVGHATSPRSAPRQQLGGDVVRVVDTETASLACALLAEAIDRRLERRDDGRGGRGARRAVQGANRVVFTVATLEYLQKGGRIGKAQALAGSLLQRQADPHRRATA